MPAHSGVGEAVAVARQVDPLQPDDEHELQAAAADAGQQRGEVAGGERANLEQVQMEHRLLDARLDEAEDDQHEHPAADLGDHLRARPAHRVVAVGLDPVRDPDHDRDQSDREGDVAPPVDLGRLALGQVAQLGKAPDGPEDAERHRDEEHRAPRHRRQHAAEHETDRRAGDGGHAVDPERQPALVGRKRVGDDRAGVGEQHRPPTPCSARMTISHSAPALPSSRSPTAAR